MLKKFVGDLHIHTCLSPCGEKNMVPTRIVKEALEIVRKDNPFPSICGRVCTTPCEENCTSRESGDPIAKIDNLDEIQKQYKAVFMATGAHKSIKLGLPSEDKEGVLDAIEFLRDVNLGKKVNLGEKVGVIGGGNAAIDAARVAKRLGCKEVTILYRRTKREMPADYREVDAAMEEGINIQFLVAPVSIISKNGEIEGVRCIKMKLGDVDRSGRRRPIPIEGSEFEIKLDNLISAIGQEPDLSYLQGKIKTDGGKTVFVDKETLQTNIPNVFAGGDAVTGPATVTQAIAHGKIAATSIHKYLRGESLERKYDVIRTSVSIEPLKLSEEEMEELRRPKMPCLEMEKRISGFDEVELGYSSDMAMNEAKRCLRCDWQPEE